MATKNSIFKTLLATSLLIISSVSFAANVDMNADENDLAIKGYDPVAYLTVGKPVQGVTKYTATYKGAIYRFNSASNRDMFRKSPQKYAPQYGGYCAFGVAMDKKFDTDPTAWKIIADKLYLNLNKDVQNKWKQDTQKYLAMSEHNWMTIKDKTPAQLQDEE